MSETIIINCLLFISSLSLFFVWRILQVLRFLNNIITIESMLNSYRFKRNQTKYICVSGTYNIKSLILKFWIDLDQVENCEIMFIERNFDVLINPRKNLMLDCNTGEELYLEMRKVSTGEIKK